MGGISSNISYYCDLVVYSEEKIESKEYNLYRIFFRPKRYDNESLSILICHLTLMKSRDTKDMEGGRILRWEGHYDAKLYKGPKYQWDNTLGSALTNLIFMHYLKDIDVTFSPLNEYRQSSESADLNYEKGWRRYMKDEIPYQLYEHNEGGRFYSTDVNEQKEVVKSMFDLTNINMLNNDNIKHLGFSIRNTNFGIDQGDVLYFVDYHDKMIFMIWINIYNLRIANDWQKQIVPYLQSKRG